LWALLKKPELGKGLSIFQKFYCTTTKSINLPFSPDHFRLPFSCFLNFKNPSCEDISSPLPFQNCWPGWETGGQVRFWQKKTGRFFVGQRHNLQGPRTADIWLNQSRI
jgi:hypothetical protein